eukprot:364644-Chlamydomonas_euryale.AAC.18
MVIYKKKGYVAWRCRLSAFGDVSGDEGSRRTSGEEGSEPYACTCAVCAKRGRVRLLIARADPSAPCISLINVSTKHVPFCPCKP